MTAAPSDALYALFLAFSSAMNHFGLFFIATASLALLLAFTAGHPTRKRLPHVAAVMLLSFLLAMSLKTILAVPRPCALGAPSLVPCPSDFSLPSAHVAVAAGLALALLGLSTFPLGLLWAALITASRLFLGVHSIADVSAGLALAVFSMALVDRLGFGEPILHHSRRWKDTASSRSSPHTPLWLRRLLHLFAGEGGYSEGARKSVQALVGLLILLFALLFGPDAAVLPVAWVLSGGLILFHLKSANTGLPIVDLVLEWLERPSAPPGYGALTFFAGVLLALTLLPPPLALAMLVVLSLSDAASALVGRFGSHTLFYNPKKTYIGTLAFVLSSLPVFLIAGMPGLALALLAAILESLPLGLDDNLVIPWAGVLIAALKLG